jgi:hypothetical protein
MLMHIHPKEYDQLVDLLEKKEYFCQLKFDRHRCKDYLLIKRVVTHAHLEQLKKF